MPILRLKPHILQVLSQADGYEDENGDWHGGTENWSDYMKCDVVPAGQANQILLPDGTQTYYSYVVYLPKNAREFMTGEKVRISFNGKGTLAEKKVFTVKGFHAYQHQCKMWL